MIDVNDPLIMDLRMNFECIISLVVDFKIERLQLPLPLQIITWSAQRSKVTIKQRVLIHKRGRGGGSICCFFT